MHSNDLNAFGEILDAVCSLLSRGAYQPNPTNTALFFRSLARHSLAEVRAAFDAHVADHQRGRFVPVPADILAQLDGIAADDGRLGSEEAWALAMRSTDEGETVVWTEEIATALGICLPILSAGDEVGARMAFKEAYARLVDVSRNERKPPRWSPSLGHDQERRQKALAAAAAAGLLARSDAIPLPAPRESVRLLGNAADYEIPAEARAGLLALRDWLTAKTTEEISPDFSAKVETMLAKSVVTTQVEQFLERDSGLTH